MNLCSQHGRFTDANRAKDGPSVFLLLLWWCRGRTPAPIKSPATVVPPRRFDSCGRLLIVMLAGQHPIELRSLPDQHSMDA